MCLEIEEALEEESLTLKADKTSPQKRWVMRQEKLVTFIGITLFGAIIYLFIWYHQFIEALTNYKGELIKLIELVINDFTI